MNVMGIYIENIEMPKNCNHCFVTPGCCPAIRKRIESDTPGYTWIPANYRHEDCPLVHAHEPHGRLIDADEFLKRAIGTKCFRGDFALMLEELVGESTTIIPASGTEVE